MIPPIYLDYNGTTPHDPEVIEAMRPFLETEFGNPSSSHWYGAGPQRAVERARKQVADLLGCDPEEITFTSGGTESNNHAILGATRILKSGGNHLITSAFEHPAVLEVFRYLESKGFKASYLPVGKNGLVRVKDVEEAIRPETILISIMHANNEVGTIQPITDISKLAKSHDIVFHTDAAQSVGKIPTDVKKLGVDLLSVAGHKLYAPKGIGALYVKKPLKLEKFCHGAGQEMGKRAGTENVLEIVGLGKACEIAKRDLNKNMHHMKMLRDLLYDGLASRISNFQQNGDPNHCLPNTLSVSFYELEAENMLIEMGSTIAASAGAACHSNVVKVSHVLEAMNVPVEWAKGTLRFSVGRMTTAEDIDIAIKTIVATFEKLNRTPQ